METATALVPDVLMQASLPKTVDVATRLFLEVFQADDDAKFVATAQGRVLYANKAAQAMFGYFDPRSHSVFDLVLNNITVPPSNDDSGAVMIPGSRGRLIFDQLLRGPEEGKLSVEEFLQIRTEGGVIDARLSLKWIMVDGTQYIRITVMDLAPVDIDPLTGLCRRRKLDKDYEREILVQRRRAAQTSWMETDPEKRHRLAYLMIDIDHFKGVNDRYGHLAGDQVLRSVANRIRKECRTNDVVARYGGEEIVVLLPEATSEGALIVAQRIHEAVRSKAISLGTSVLKVTVSIGVAFMETGDTAETLAERADQAMYTAKNRGRDRIVWTSPAD